MVACNQVPKKSEPQPEPAASDGVAFVRRGRLDSVSWSWAQKGTGSSWERSWSRSVRPDPPAQVPSSSPSQPSPSLRLASPGKPPTARLRLLSAAPVSRALSSRGTVRSLRRPPPGRLDLILPSVGRRAGAAHGGASVCAGTSFLPSCVPQPGRRGGPWRLLGKPEGRPRGHGAQNRWTQRSHGGQVQQRR